MTKDSVNAQTAPGGIKSDFANKLRAAFAHCLRVRLTVKLAKGGSNNMLYNSVLTALNPATKGKLLGSATVNKNERDAVQARVLADMTELRASFVKQHGMSVDVAVPLGVAAPRAFSQFGHLSAARQKTYNDQAGVFSRSDSDQLLRSLLAQEKAEYEAAVSSAAVLQLTDTQWTAAAEFERWCTFRPPATINITCDPLVDFWAHDIYRQQFPALFLCALMWFGLPGTSSTSERMASKATRIYTPGLYFFFFFTSPCDSSPSTLHFLCRSRQAAA